MINSNIGQIINNNAGMMGMQSNGAGNNSKRI